MKPDHTHIVVFTDLDGTLLNHDDYDYTAAKPLIKRLKALHIPLVFVTSKTITEVRSLRKELDIDGPYICENGSLIVVPDKLEYIADQIAATRKIEEGEIICFKGNPRSELLDILNTLRAHYDFRNFADMSALEISECTGLRVEQSIHANQRLASEPVLWLDNEVRLKEFYEIVARNHLRIVKGGRFYHIMGDTDKSEAVKDIKLAFENYNSTKIHSIVLGDSENDLGMLASATTAVVMPKPDGSHMQLDGIQSVVYAEKHGALGWSETMDKLLNKLV